MQIVIDIDENLYTRLFDNGVEFNTDDKYDLERSVRHGKVLPKGHGRLIDADELKALSYEVLIDDDNPNTADGLSAFNGVVEDDIDHAPTIIDADKEENNGCND